jgi:hypothetical protein
MSSDEDQDITAEMQRMPINHGSDVFNNEDSYNIPDYAPDDSNADVGIQYI